jgi:excinuclease ABC C subunit
VRKLASAGELTMISKEDVKSLPDKPGVYFFKSRSSETLYIGKAKSLRKRVSSYTHRSYRHSKRTRQLVRRIRAVDFTICGSELEALLLESRLIKEHLPEYNIAQRKLRNYPFVKITVNEDFPRAFVAWEIESDRAKYLGPFARWYDAQEAVELVSKIFPLRKCDGEIAPGSQKPCLNYHINNCLGPCTGKVGRGDYRKMIGSTIRLLSGQQEKLIRDMGEEMKEAAANLQFERAARLRDQISGIREVISKHKFRVNAVDSNNLVAIYPSSDANSVELFLIRKGELAAQKRMSVSAQTDDELLQIITTDIERVFFSALEPRSKSLGKLEVDAMNIIARWLYMHQNDQSLVYIKKKRSKVETIASAAEKVKSTVSSICIGERDR